MADAREYEVVAWSDIHGNRHEGEPTVDNLWAQGGDIDGVLIKSHTTGDRDSVEHKWVYMTEPWEDWSDMEADIDSALDMYGLA